MSANICTRSHCYRFSNYQNIMFPVDNNLFPDTLLFLFEIRSTQTVIERRNIPINHDESYIMNADTQFFYKEFNRYMTISEFEQFGFTVTDDRDDNGFILGATITLDKSKVVVCGEGNLEQIIDKTKYTYKGQPFRLGTKLYLKLVRKIW